MHLHMHSRHITKNIPVSPSDSFSKFVNLSDLFLESLPKKIQIFTNKEGCFFLVPAPLMARGEQSGRFTGGYNIRLDIIRTKAGSLWIPVPVRSMPVSPWCGESGQGPRDTDRLIRLSLIHI